MTLPTRTLKDYARHHEDCDANKCDDCGRWRSRCIGVFTPKPCSCGLDHLLAEFDAPGAQEKSPDQQFREEYGFKGAQERTTEKNDQGGHESHGGRDDLASHHGPWLPIASAPRDRRLLLRVPFEAGTSHEVQIGQYDDDYRGASPRPFWRYECEGSAFSLAVYSRAHSPSHWMPLPDTPRAGTVQPQEHAIATSASAAQESSSQLIDPSPETIPTDDDQGKGDDDASR